MDEIIYHDDAQGDIVKRSLAQAPLEYIRENLKYGLLLNTLARQSLDLSRGETYTYLPERISMEDSLKFKAGGKVEPHSYGRDEKRGVRWEAFLPLNAPIEMEFNRHLESSSENVCVVEDIFMEPDSIYLKEHRDEMVERYMFFENEAYLILFQEDAGKEIVRDTISCIPTGHYLNFFMTSFPPGERIDIQRYDTIPAALIYQFVARVEKIVTKAYDGESYIVWDRRK
jgi:hypothetical protein